MSLLGSRILVTRAAAGWEELARRASACGGSVEFRSPIRRVTPAELEPVRAAASGIDGFDWIVVTSVSGVDALAESLRDAGRVLDARRSRVACVGPATARAAGIHGLDPVLKSEQGSGADLAAELAARLAPGQRVLVVRPQAGSAFPLEPLIHAGGVVSSVAFYATTPSPEAAAIAADLERGRYDAVVVTAPSAMDAISPARLRCVRRIALGATTARALAGAGAPCDAVAAHPTPDAVADALESLC